ncbi:MAG: EAL domain-containing protein [Pseudomonadota bacterium]|nr:EAL domain-containing protein [Pseudomonadota bacterium]
MRPGKAGSQAQVLTLPAAVSVGSMPLEKTRFPLSVQYRRTLAIIWPFLAILLVLLCMGWASLMVLTAVRASITAESAWSKAQKEAVYDLVHYAQSRQERDYQRFLNAVEVIRWDQRMREEMDKPDPDRALVHEGMLRGQVQPADVDTTYHAYRSFHDFNFMRRVVALWKQGDRGMADLVVEGNRLREQILAEAKGAAPHPVDLEPVYQIDNWITPKAREFSVTLGDVARQVEFLLVFCMGLVTAMLVPLGFLFANRMVRRNLAFEDALTISEERFQLAVTGSNDGIWDWSARGSLYLSPRFRELVGLTPTQPAPSLPALLSRLHPSDDLPARRRLWLQARRAGVIDIECRLRAIGDEYRWFRIRGQAICDPHGQPVRMVGSMSDTNDYRAAAMALFGEKERLRVTLEAIRDAVVTTDTAGRVQYLNPAAEKLTGWSDRDALGQALGVVCKVVDEVSHAPLLTSLDQALRETAGGLPAREAVLITRDDRKILVDAVTAPIYDERQRLLGMVVALRDVSQEREHQADLNFRASHDALTGLINRSEFDRRLSLALKHARTEGRAHAVLYLDLDQFKVVNDTCGHAAGDELIKQISLLMPQRLRATDTLARLGGDEFAVLLENCQPKDALRIAEQLRETLVGFRFAWDGKPFSLGVSIGLVNVQDTPMTPAEVLSTADATCYLAKEKGRNRVQVYSPDDHELVRRRGEMEWTSRIREALERNLFQLYAQDILNLQGPPLTGRHVEVLVRMIDPEGPLVLPMAFIPAAERFGLMTEIDRWVVREMLATCAELVARDGPDAIAMCAVNVSGSSLGEERFRNFVLDQFVRFDVPFDRICFEVTETTAIANLGAANRFMSELKALGCRFALDDFGSGWSSFAYLKQLPVDYLKIDGGFVKDMLDDPIDRSMVETINRIGHVMGKQTIAEHAESPAIIAELRRLGVDFAQGLGVTEPKPFSRLRATGLVDPSGRQLETN